MNWLNRLESRFGHLAIQGLPLIIVGFNLLVYLLWKLRPEFLDFLVFDRELILQGQVWRLFTFAFIPAWGGRFLEVLVLALYLYMTYIIGTGVERAMGAFRLNVYYALGVAGISLAGLLFGGLGFTGLYGNGLLNNSLLFAFATFYPETVFYMMGILPMRVTWLAWLSGAGLMLGFLRNGWEFRLSVIAGLLNYFTFFGPELVRMARHRQQVAVRRSRFDRDVRTPASATMHECAVCHRTEVSAPDLEFRVGRDGQEYCLEHLPKAPAKNDAPTA
jgi:hypothetical protein